MAEFSGKEIQQLCRKSKDMSEVIYLVMNKPCGYVCSAVSDSHQTVFDLLTPELQSLVQGAKRGHRLHTIGRLDSDTSGLLLFTTDGLFSHNIAANSNITKCYLAKLVKSVSPEIQPCYIEKAAAGLTLPPEKKYGEQQAEPATLHFIKDDICEISIHEGKFHEVRRIFQALGNEVADLKRISIGNFKLPSDLSPGQYRKLTKDELELIHPQKEPLLYEQ